MKYLSMVIAFLATIAAAISAPEEHFDTLKVGENVYKNVTVTRVSATDVYFIHGAGGANAKLKDLTPEMQKHFGFDPAKAKAVEQSQQAARAGVQYHFRVAAATNTPPQTKADIKLELEDAMAKVRAIVNQPVKQIAYRRDMESQLGRSKEGWFHEGANKPDFNNVDVRKTAETPYAKYKYITSNLNPGVVFLGSELEFNPNTKYFYTDRNLPKKKLTPAEGAEINRLYRIIGQNEAALAK